MHARTADRIARALLLLALAAMIAFTVLAFRAPFAAGGGR